MQLSAECSTVDSTLLDYDTVCIFSLAEEDGELKVVEIKDFADPQKRTTFFTVLSKAGVMGMPDL